MQHLLSPPTGLALGRVKDTADPQSRGRVKVALVATDMEVWAPCVVPSAGSAGGVNYGVSFLPKTDEIVLVAFLTPDQPFILGAVWSGQNTLPSEAAPVAQRYAIKTGAETTMVFDDSAPSFSVSTRNQNEITLTDAGDTCTIKVGSTTIQATTTGVTITTTSSIELQTASLTVTAASVNVNAGMSQFSGVVQCDTLITNSVVSAAYTPGAGNIW
ncbi:MAG TPA: phage baseplate assembly protein V [Rhodopila sp.]|nr:phage baseplate assembly protein V [Rhodopila sp.]